MKIAHIINPVKVTESSDLFIAQPITFETMRKAKNFTRSNSNLDVELFYTCYDEDLDIAPNGFIKTKLLEKSILDYKEFEKKRKLPLIKDILDRLYESSDADYFIYTNVDIAVQENFYEEVKNIIDSGYDAFVINRRTIDKKYTSIEEIPQMYKDKGEKHPGYDCFVFRRDVYPKYELGTACIGANWIGRVIISNVIAYSNKFKVFEDKYLTFHIGDDRNWKISDYNDYDKNNESEVIHLLKKLNDKNLINNDLLKLFIKQHKIDLTLNMFIPYSHKITHNFSFNPDEIYFKNYKPSNQWNESYVLKQNPIFIVGYPRSGTTLFQSLLSTQDNLISLPETHFFNWVRNNLEVKADKIVNKNIEKLINIIRQRIVLSTNAEDQIEKLIQLQVLSPKMLFEIIILDNLMQYDKDINDIKEKRWIEKTPDHILYLDVMLRFYPNAKIIYMMRNPEQAILSRRKNFINEANWKIEQHINSWKRSIQAFEDFQKKYPNKIKLIKIEELAEKTEQTMINVCEFLSIKFDNNKLDNYQNIVKRLKLPTESWKRDVEKNKISSSISNNNKKLEYNDRIKFVKQLKNLLDKYGYFCDEYKQLSLNNNMKINQSDMSLIDALDNLCSVNTFKNPIRKFKAYKNLLKVYNESK